MQIETSARKREEFEEKREYERVTVTLAGKLFVPAERATIECQIINISGSGASVRCEEPPPLQAFVVLYMDGIGRFDAVTVRFVKGELGLRFVFREAKRQRLLDDIRHFVEGGVSAPTKQRRHAREASVSEGYFKRPNGEMVACGIIDISLQGVSLTTKIRPPLDEIIYLGKTCGRVVRHHGEGIAVHFLNLATGSFHGG